MPDLRLVALTKRFGETVAVDALDLRIEGGEFFSLLGPSGCGKTTTLRIVAGLEPPTSGRLILGEKDITDLPPHRRDIGMVFQNYALFPHYTVAGNVAYGLRARRTPKAEAKGRVARALERVALAGFETRKVHELSGGQQQRVALARAIVIEPSLLLFDEPLSNLDAALRVETRAELRRLHEQLGTTTIYVTHDQEEALVLSDRLAVLKDGRLQQIGTPSEVYARPANQFVATFLGGANLVEVEVLGLDGDRATVRLDSGERLEVPVGSHRPEAGARAILCVRPEAVRLAPGGQGPEAVVVALTFNGARYDYDLRVGGAAWRASEPNEGPPRAESGATVRLAIGSGATLIPMEGALQEGG